jgi:hypothetical protein
VHDLTTRDDDEIQQGAPTAICREPHGAVGRRIHRELRFDRGVRRLLGPEHNGHAARSDHRG